MNVDLYKITNLVNGFTYVGYTTGSYLKRWTDHKYDAYRNMRDTLIAKAIREFGEENFKVEQLACVESKEDAWVMEQYYINKYGTYYKNGKGYNLTLGGQGARGGNERAVVQVDKEGNFINEFESIAQAVKETGVPSNSIGASCRGKSRFEGRICRGKWRFSYRENYYEELEKEKLEKQKTTRKKRVS